MHGKNDREVFSALFPNADAQELKELSLQKDQCFREQVRLPPTAPGLVWACVWEATRMLVVCCGTRGVWVARR